MLRIIIRFDDAGFACNVGGAVITTFKTFEVNAPEVEGFLGLPTSGYCQRQIVGVEFVPEPLTGAAIAPQPPQEAVDQ